MKYGASLIWITATAYDGAGASSAAVQQISAKPQSGGITIMTPGNGSTVNWPTTLMASANPGTPVSSMRVLIDGQQAYAATGDTLNTALKVFTGTHQLTVQSLDSSNNVSASASLNVDAEPGDMAMRGAASAMRGRRRTSFRISVIGW